MPDLSPLLDLVPHTFGQVAACALVVLALLSLGVAVASQALDLYDKGRRVLGGDDSD